MMSGDTTFDAWAETVMAGADDDDKWFAENYSGYVLYLLLNDT